MVAPALEAVRDVCARVGREIAGLHQLDMTHGDLTLSNIQLRPLAGGLQPVLIDFGLVGYSGLPEDKAVDLYVLERALTLTHPVHSEHYNRWVLEGYAEGYTGKGGAKKCKDVMRRLADVRLRGRKRSMLG